MGNDPLLPIAQHSAIKKPGCLAILNVVIAYIKF